MYATGTTFNLDKSTYSLYWIIFDNIIHEFRNNNHKHGVQKINLVINDFSLVCERFINQSVIACINNRIKRLVEEENIIYFNFDETYPSFKTLTIVSTIMWQFLF